MNRHYFLKIHFMNKKAETVIVQSRNGFDAIVLAGLTYESKDEKDEIISIEITYTQPNFEQTQHVVSNPCNEHYMLIN